MKTIDAEIIEAVADSIEPNASSLSEKEQQTFAEICADITSKEVAAIEALEITKRLATLKELYAIASEDHRDTILDKILEIGVR